LFYLVDADHKGPYAVAHTKYTQEVQSKQNKTKNKKMIMIMIVIIKAANKLTTSNHTH